MTADQVARLRLVARTVDDWDTLLRAAASHGLLPLLALHLDAVASEDIPVVVRERLRDALRRNTRRNLALTTELLGLLADLRARGVLAIPYKGPVLATSVYGHVGLREFGDLDVLVRREDVATAKAVLRHRGYRPCYDLSNDQETALIETRYEHPFERVEDGVMVEIQWAVVPRYFALPFDYGALWARAQEVAIGGHTVASLSSEDLVLVLTAHGGKHLWSRLGWVCDVAELVRSRATLDWRAVGAEADRLGARRLLSLGLRLARDVLGAPLPSDAEATVQEDAAVAMLSAQVQEAWWTASETSPGVWESIRFHLRARERWRDRMRYCLSLATTPTPGDWTVLGLPRPLFALYYPLRAIRLAVKYGELARRQLVARRGPA